jgi:hypothetical protein
VVASHSRGSIASNALGRKLTLPPASLILGVCRVLVRSGLNHGHLGPVLEFRR